MERQIYRSRENKMIAGVCGGIAEYFNIDPTIVRLIWALFTITYGLGLIAYIVAVIVIPERIGGEYGFSQPQNTGEFKGQVVGNNKTHIIIGGLLIIGGALILVKRFVHIDYTLLWPVVFIIIGIFIIYRGWRRG